MASYTTFDYYSKFYVFDLRSHYDKGAVGEALFPIGYFSQILDQIQDWKMRASQLASR